MSESATCQQLYRRPDPYIILIVCHICGLRPVRGGSILCQGDAGRTTVGPKYAAVFSTTILDVLCVVVSLFVEYVDR